MPEKNGIFTVRSAYRLVVDDSAGPLIASSSSNPNGREGWKAIWSCRAPPKVLTFACRLASDSLATWCNKHKRSLEVFKTCLVYGMEDEDSFHVFEGNMP